MGRFRGSPSTLAGARDIVIGFALTTVVVLIVLALWPHTGVAGTIYEPWCQPVLGTSMKCSIRPASASINLSQYISSAAGPALSWQTKSDAAGHFHVDALPPGGYSLFAQATGDYEGRTNFPVFSGQVTHIDLLLAQRVGIGICLAPTDRIATPGGSVMVAKAIPGMIVWTLDASGQRVAAPVLAVTHRPALAGQDILRITLSDGRVVEVSPGHPTVTGKRVGDLRVGDVLDGSRVTTVDELPFAGATWDLLPA